jgi:hypothetical protein
LKIIWVIPFQNVIGSFMYAMVCKKIWYLTCCGVCELIYG